MNKEEAKKIFGENLRRIRTAKGMSQDELATKLGYVNRSSINKIEVGRSDMPRSKIELASKILGVSPLELFRNEPIEDEVIEEMVDDYLLEIEQKTKGLSEQNRIRLMAYLDALVDSQEDDK